MPVVALERLNDDLTLGLLLLFFERARRVRRHAACGVWRTSAELLWHDVCGEFVAVARDDHALHHVPQLANVVASPVVRHQRFDRRGRHRLELETKALARRGDEMLDERGDIRSEE